MGLPRTWPLKVVEPGLVRITGSFRPNSSSTVDNTLNTGLGFSVARTSTGLFTITFTEGFIDYRSFNATLQLNSADDKFVQVGAYSAANKTLEIRVWDVSGVGVADVSSHANNRIHFSCVFKATSV